MWFACSRVQAVHKPVTGFGAAVEYHLFPSPHFSIFPAKVADSLAKECHARVSSSMWKISSKSRLVPLTSISACSTYDSE